jgi:hypothetical protein
LICAKFGENQLSGSGEVENVKVYKQRDGQMTDITERQ